MDFNEGITIYTNKQMEFIVRIIILLGICNFLYKMNFYKGGTKKTEKKRIAKMGLMPSLMKHYIHERNL